jgi:NDP-sugar pyrophosphorylase family protein
MQAVIMAGGKGTRLRPFTNILPKPLVPIGEKSIIEIVLNQLERDGFDKVKIVVGYKSALIRAVVGGGDKFGLDISYYQEDEPMGTVGALSMIGDLDDDFLVMNGDICTDLNFKYLFDTHKSMDVDATVGAYARDERIELGVIETDHNNLITRFTEKPVKSVLVSMGVYALSKSALRLIPQNQYFGFDQLIKSMLVNSPKFRAFAFVYSGIWYDIGRFDDYERMLQAFGGDPEKYLLGNQI